MALPLAKAAPLKPQIKLAQALSEFEAVLADDQKAELRMYRGQLPPTPIDVMRFTAEVDRTASRRSRQCVGTRLTNVLHAVQQFSTIVDFMVGSSQSQIAGAIWGTVRISLQLASAISSYFDQLSTLFMKIGLTCPRYQDFGVLYPESKRLQNALCEYFIVIVRLCKQAVEFLRKPFWSQLSSSILKPFDSQFGSFHQDLEILASAIREEVTLASNQAQQNEATEMSRFRALARKFSDTSSRDLGDAKRWKRKEAELHFLNACSVYNHEKSWKQARKQGTTIWICHDESYKQWKKEKMSSTLWCTGILGSGKTVLSANVVEDLSITTPAVVAYFFCRYDEIESLQARTIIGSIARQIFEHIKPNIVDIVVETRSGIIDTDQVLDYIQKLLPSSSYEYFIIIDGLDECEEKEARLILQCLKNLLMSKHVFRVYFSSRPDIFRWIPALLEPQWNVSMSQRNPDIEEYIEDTLKQRLESGNLFVGDPTVILTIRDTLLENARGMFLWVVFQIDSICCQKTDAAILTALEDLPKDLPDTFNRILRKLQHSNTADPHFCRRIFDLVAAAQRPLMLEELREAVSVEPGETTWDANKMVNDMLKPLLESCGSLIAVDEEHLTVHFAHHSVKQHLLSEPTDSAVGEYHMNIGEADLYLGDVVVTYLNFGIFDQQLTKTSSTMLPQVVNYPSAILESLPQSSLANRVAVRLLKNRKDFRLDIHSQLKSAAGISEEFKKRIQPGHPFLSYAQKYWLVHTKEFKPTRQAVYTLWQRLINEKVKTIELPWAPERWDDFDDKYMKWIMQNEHWALIDQTLVEFNKRPYSERAARILLEFLEKKATDMNCQDASINAAILTASHLNNKAVVLLLLRKGADINAGNGILGNALQVASLKGHEDIVKLLLEHEANINAEGGRYGTALQAASVSGHKVITRLLLENGANVNAESGYHGTALHAASAHDHEEIARLLVEKGANVNAKGSNHGTALQLVSDRGNEAIVRLLLENRANVNAQIEPWGNALQAASTNGHLEIVRLLLENGADVNAQNGPGSNALQAASRNGHLEIVRVLLGNGAMVNAKDGDISNALQAASAYGHEETVRLLLENGANVDVKGGYGGTALLAAASNGHEKIVRLLLENGANVNGRRNDGIPLEVALKQGTKSIVQLLLDKGAIVNNRIIKAASDSDNKEIIKLIRNARGPHGHLHNLSM